MMLSFVKWSTITALFVANICCISAVKFCSMTSISGCDEGQICCNYQCVYGSNCLGRSCDLDSDCSSLESCCSGRCWDRLDCEGHSCSSSSDCSSSQLCCSGLCAFYCPMDFVGIALGSIFASIFLIGFIVAIIIICKRRRRPAIIRGSVVRNQPQEVKTESAARINYRQPPSYPPLQAGQPYYQPGYPQYGYGATNHVHQTPVTNFAPPPPPYQAVASGQTTGGGNNEQTNRAEPYAP